VQYVWRGFSSIFSILFLKTNLKLQKKFSRKLCAIYLARIPEESREFVLYIYFQKCVDAWVWVGACGCAWVCVCACVCVWIIEADERIYSHYIFKYVLMRVGVCVRVFVSVGVCLCVCVCVSVCVCVGVCVCVCVRVCIY